MPATTPAPRPGGQAAYVWLLAAVAAIGGFLFGFDSGVINGTVDALRVALGSSDLGTGFSVASMLLGCAVGALVSGRVADRVGRRAAMAATAVVFVVSAIGSGLARDAATFVLFRVLGGVGVGAASVLAPAYIAEVAPAAMRGRLASLQQLAIVVGLFSAFVSNYWIAQQAGDAQAEAWAGVAAWRWMFWVEVLPAWAYLLGLLWIPESPRHLVATGRSAEAARVFRRLLGPAAAGMVEAVQRSLVVAPSGTAPSGAPSSDGGPLAAGAPAGEQRARWRDLLRPGGCGLRPVVWVGLAAAVLQQLVGINVIFYYGAVLWQAAGFSEREALWQNVIAGVVNILSTLVALAVVDRVGRRPLLIAGALGMAASLGALSWVFASVAPGPAGQISLDPQLGRLALTLAFVYVFFFAATWGPVLWVLLGELFPNHLRGTAMAAATMAHWLANFAVTMTFPWLLTTAGLAPAYALYAGAAVCAAAFALLGMRETRGTELESLR